jgi:hypothetical protein
MRGFNNTTHVYFLLALIPPSVSTPTFFSIIRSWATADPSKNLTSTHRWLETNEPKFASPHPSHSPTDQMQRQQPPELHLPAHQHPLPPRHPDHHPSVHPHCFHHHCLLIVPPKLRDRPTNRQSNVTPQYRPRSRPRTYLWRVRRLLIRIIPSATAAIFSPQRSRAGPAQGITCVERRSAKQAAGFGLLHTLQGQTCSPHRFRRLRR